MTRRIESFAGLTVLIPGFFPHTSACVSCIPCSFGPARPTRSALRNREA